MIFKTKATELHYEDFGQGPAVAVLHDHPSNRELRTAVFDALAEAGCRVIILNSAGLGSSLRATFSPSEQTAQVLALFTYLGIGRAVVIGIGMGGYVALDLLERFPGRVAKASFVVSAELAADLRRRAGSKGTLEALRSGHCGDLKGVFLHVRRPAPAPPQLPRLRAWINKLREGRRSAYRSQRRDCAALLANLELPPLLIEEESSSAAYPCPVPLSGIGNFRTLHALSAPLQSLLNALLPDRESRFEENAEEVFSEHR